MQKHPNQVTPTTWLIVAFRNKPAKAAGAPGAAGSLPVSPHTSDPPSAGTRGPSAPARSPQGRLQARALPWRPQRARRPGEPAPRFVPVTAASPRRGPGASRDPRTSRGPRAGSAAPSPGLAAHGGGNPATRRRPSRARTARARRGAPPFPGPAPRQRLPAGGGRSSAPAPPRTAPTKRVTNRLLIENNRSGEKHGIELCTPTEVR